MHARAVARAEQRGLPAPDMKIGTSNHFDAKSWTIVYDGRALEASAVSNERWEELLSIGAGHEVEHEYQWVQMGRYHMGLKNLNGPAAALELGYDVKKVGGVLDGLGPITKESEGFADAEKWYESVYGKHGAARAATLKRIPHYGPMTAAQKRAYQLARDIGEEFEAALSAGRPEAELAPIRARLRRAHQIAEGITAKVEQLEQEFQKYRNLPEEVDAREAQDEFRQAQAQRREAAKLKVEVDRLQAEAEASARAAAEKAAASGAPAPEPAADPVTWDIHDEDGLWDPDKDPLLQRR
jgi:hypothetical protein